MINLNILIFINSVNSVYLYNKYCMYIESMNGENYFNLFVLFC